ncbi:MAG: undecaprenyl-phosphate glucose phosphotransferase [Bacteroidia bacterium]|nr:undecaprenyl-phosphate glucose phosphotransferase [Bacteroidia bacterium]
MPIGYSRYTNKILLIGDLLTLNLAFILVHMLLHYSTIYEVKDQLYYLITINIAWVIISNYFELAVVPRHVGDEEVFSKLVRAVILFTLITIPAYYLISANAFNASELLMQCLTFAGLVFIWRFIILRGIKFLRMQGLNYKRVIILGGGHQAVDMYGFFNNKARYGYKLLGAFTLKPFDDMPVDFKESSLEAVEKFCIENEIDEIFCSLSGLRNDDVAEIFRFADKNLIRFKVIPDFKGFFNKKVIVDFYDMIPVLVMRPEPLESLSNRVIKRLFDIVFSLGVIICVFPWLFPVFAIIIKATSEGPVFFKQKRSGKNNEEFTCLKFRTMRVNSEADEKQATRTDPRITPIGAFLRKTSLDELPQFFNTLWGDMSVVGPRPHMLRHTQEYSEMIDKFMVRHFAKPGITGWAQAKGFRGDTVDPVLMQKRVELDVWYVENYSFLLDIKIILLTVWVIFRGQKEAF